MTVALYIPRNLYAKEPYRQFADILAQQPHCDIILLPTPHIPKDSEVSILHIMGCWDYHAARLMRQATRQRIPTLFSPLGGLQPWIIENHTEKALEKQAFQRRMVREAKAVHAWSIAEKNTLEKLDWNGNIAYIPNPIVTASTSVDITLQQFAALYQKVADSNACLLINDQLRQLVYALLQLGLNPMLIDNAPQMNTLRQALADCTDEGWRLVMLYAYDQGITPLVHTAIDLLQHSMPQIDISEIDRFDVSEEDAVTLSDMAPEEMQASDIYATLQLMINMEKHHRATLGHYAALYQILHHADYDEHLLSKLITQHHLMASSRRLMRQLATITQLSEGYIPAELYTEA